MGIFKEIGSAVKYVTGITSLEEAKQDYIEAEKEYNDFVSDINFKIKKHNSTVEKLNKEKQNCIALINIYGFIDKKNKNVNMDKIEEELAKNNYDVSKIKNGSLILSALSGGALSTVAYTVASTFGIASTGTAIATLSGAAATNATLAFLGGGALAAGGGGMVAGATVLGAVAIIPLVGVSIMNLNKADKIRDKIKELDIQMYTIKKQYKDIGSYTVLAEAYLSKITTLKEKYSKDMRELVEKMNIRTKEFANDLNNIKIVEVKQLKK